MCFLNALRNTRAEMAEIGFRSGELRHIGLEETYLWLGLVHLKCQSNLTSDRIGVNGC